MRKKFLLTMFSLVLFAFCGTSLNAQVAKIGSTPYATFAAAYSAAQAGDEIDLCDNVTVTSKLIIDKAVTIDGNDYSILADANTVWYTVSGKFNTKSYKVYASITADATLKNITFDANSAAGGITVDGANVVLDNFAIKNLMADAVTLNNNANVVVKTRFAVEGCNNTFIDARNGVVTVAEGTLFDMAKFTGNVSPAKSDLKGAVDAEGNPFFCAYGSTDYYKTLTNKSYSDLTLLADVEFANDVTLSGTLNLNDHNLTVAEGKVLKVSSSLTIDVDGDGELNAAIVLINIEATLTTDRTDIAVTTNVSDTRVVYEDGAYKVVTAYVAQIDTQGYTTLQAAFDAVKDSETITLIDNVTVSVATAAYNYGTYIDGVRYTGDKSFTVDFNGKTVTDDGCVNDYLIYINNKGEKASEITFTNGTIVSNNGCWSAVCVNSSAATQKVVLNLNGMNITNSNDAEYSGNPVVRVRNLATVNVNYNTVITSDGASYGVAANTDGSTLNINEGATIVQKNSGTTGGNSVFAAVGGKGVINIKGGTITSDKFGVHTMTTGTPVINISGGTITAPVALKSSTNGGNGELATINVTGGTINGTLETYTENGKIVVSGGTFSKAVAQEYCAEGYSSLPNLAGKYVIGATPTAEVNSFGATTVAAGEYHVYDGSSIKNSGDGDMPLSFVMQFSAVKDEEDMETSPFADWYGDFVLTFTGLENDEFTANGCYLAGHYGSFGWVKIPVDGMLIEDGARYPVMLGVGLGQKYDYICSSVEDFKCALYLAPEILEANPNIQVKLELDVVDNSKGSDEATSALINNDKVYLVADYTFGADDFEKVELPKVEVIDIKSSLTDSDPDLTFALNFKIKDADKLTEEYLEKLFAQYGDWYTDYVLTISGLSQESVTFNANGGADGYLAGQYDAWSDSWVSVPFENVEIKNGASLYIMEYAAELMDKSGLRFTLQEIAEIVQNFNCGVFFTPEFMAANPDMKVTLDLVVFTENEQGDKTFYNNGPVASNSFDVTNIAAVVSGENKQSQYYATFAEAYAAAEAGETVSLLADLTMKDIITIDKAITLDGNGKTLTSTAARAINVSGANGVTIKNLTINASSERAINVIQNATNVTIDNVTATAANYTVNVASSAANTVVAIKNSNLTGLNVVNVGAAGANVTIDNTTINTVDNNSYEGYSSLCLNKDAKNGKIIATNVTINITGSACEDSSRATNQAEGGVISINGSIEGVDNDVAYISYGNNWYGFTTLEGAVAKANDGETVVLIRDAQGAGIVIDKSITIDFNGKTYSLTEGVGSTGTESNGFQILKGNNVTLKNGTLNVAAKSASKFYILVQNYANLDVNKMTLDGKNLDKYGDSYVLSNNSGEVNIINSTIIANDGDLAYAFDVCKYASYEAPVVNLDDKSIINGKVELSGGQFYPAQAVTVSMTKAVEKYQVADNYEELESGWYTISAPFAVNPALTEGYELFRYNEATAMWENHKNSEHNSFDLQVGRGYLYAHANGADLNLEGVANIADYSTDLSYTSAANELKGFHLVGNPYTFSISGKHFSGNVANGFYTLANSGAWVVKQTADEITVGEGFLVQAKSATAFAINKEATATRSADNGSLQINVANAKYSDVAYVSFNEGVGLSKISHQNTNIPMVYVPVGGENYSIAYMNANVEEIPFAFEAKTMGSYTISVEAQNCEFETMTLVDRFTGIETNLLLEDYSFIAKSGDNSDRFIIRLSNETLNLGDENFVYINNNGLIIDNASSNATLQIFDVMGRPVASYNLSGSANISMESLTNGVYILRLMDENNVRVQKVVID